MGNDLPTPEDMLEDLADKTATQIERLAPAAFDRAYNEMVTYHRFLLTLNATTAPDGSATSFAEISGGSFSQPYWIWTRQYRRLFQRAASRLSDDDHFIRSLAHTPSRLLPGPNDPELPKAIVQSILQLGPTMIHRIEAWLSNRASVDSSEATAGAMAGARDTKAYENALPEIIGAWERILYHSPLLTSDWRGEQDNVLRWSSVRANWPLLWLHLTNTAYSLAIAVWNEDEVGAQMFREALVRWPKNLEYCFHSEATLKHPWLLSPNLVHLDWNDAVARMSSIADEHPNSPVPDELVTSIIRVAHNDVLLLTSALLLRWAEKYEQSSGIRVRAAQDLLVGYGNHAEFRSSGGQDVQFRELFLNWLRFNLETQSVSYSQIWCTGT